MIALSWACGLLWIVAAALAWRVGRLERLVTDLREYQDPEIDEVRETAYSIDSRACANFRVVDRRLSAVEKRIAAIDGGAP